jgi:hypothetical protein
MDKEKINRAKARVKEHLHEHKNKYIYGGAFLLGAGFTALMMRERHARMQSVPDGLARVTMRSLFLFSSGNSIVGVNERAGRGHPGYIVRSMETGALFSTQGGAARAFNVSPSMLSSHLNGRCDNVNGYHFERFNIQP